VSNVPRKAYGSSPPRVALFVAGAGRGGALLSASSVIRIEGGATRVVPVAVVEEGVYAGGGSLEGTVKAFMPGRSGRLVAGEGFVSGLGLLRACSLSRSPILSSAGPRVADVGVLGVCISEVEEFDLSEALLFLRPSLRMEPSNDRVDEGASDLHGFEGMMRDA
jgi:hypothetical protein